MRKEELVLKGIHGEGNKKEKKNYETSKPQPNKMKQLAFFVIWVLGFFAILLYYWK